MCGSIKNMTARVSQKPKCLRETMNQNWNIQRVWGRVEGGLEPNCHPYNILEVYKYFLEQLNMAVVLSTSLSHQPSEHQSFLLLYMGQVEYIASAWTQLKHTNGKSAFPPITQTNGMTKKCYNVSAKVLHNFQSVTQFSER